MIGLLLAAAAQAGPCTLPRPVPGLVRDAATGAPVGDAVIRPSSGRRPTRSDAAGRFVVGLTPCDSIVATRLGYAPAVTAAGSDTVTIVMTRTAARLGPTLVTDARRGAATYVTGTADARLLGGTSAHNAIAALPLVGVRSSAGRTALSVRGSRPEQVVVVLDGVPLNDPATGGADAGDIPLAAIATAMVTPGNGVAGHGGGAVGGVIALNSASDPVFSATLGSFRRRSAEGAIVADAGPARLRVGGAYATAADDFAFRNVAAAPPADTVERRVNNDERRASVFASLIAPRAQLLLLHTDVERGLVGPMNVRAFDADRGRTTRSVLRAVSEVRGADLRGTVRILAARYGGGAASLTPFTVGSRSGDLAMSRAIGSISVDAGTGIDAVHGSTLRVAPRARAHAGVASSRTAGRLRAHVALRGDAVDRHGSQLSPSVTLERPGPVGVTLRAGRGFRIPSFYDVYFASPQRIVARALRPERVTRDIDARITSAFGCGLRCTITVEGTAFDRRTVDAIVWLPGNVGWSPANVPLERARGAELHLGAAAGRSRLTAWGGHYRTRLWDGLAEARTPYVPRWSAGGSGSARVAGLDLIAQVRHTGRRPFVNGPPLPDLELPAATVVTAGAAHVVRTPAGRLTLSLAVDDLADARPELVRRYPSAGRVWSGGLTLAP